MNGSNQSDALDRERAAGYYSTYPFSLAQALVEVSAIQSAVLMSSMLILTTLSTAFLKYPHTNLEGLKCLYAMSESEDVSDASKTPMLSLLLKIKLA